MAGCKFTTGQVGNLVGHKKIVHQGFREKCPHCPKEFTAKQWLDTHISVQHLGVKHTCERCGFSAGTISYLNTHIQVKHEGLRFACKTCEFSTTDRSNLRQHNFNIHDKISSVFRCNNKLCNFETTKKKDIINHKRAHSKEILCDQCEYTTKFSAHLQAHTKAKHEGVTFPCTKLGCSFTASFKHDIGRHIRKHHLDR